MTDQSDRQDVDGLRARLVAFSDFLNEPPQYEELRMVRDYRHEACAKWLPLVVDLIARFDAPTRDGAEGAVPFAWTIPGDDHADCNGFIPTRISREGEFTKPLYSAPPKPAPDAVREADKDRLIAMMAMAMQTAQRALQHATSPGALVAALSSLTIALQMEADHWQKYARLAAPSPDGAIFQCPECECDIACEPHGPDCSRRLDAPSPAVAAEPETEQQFEDRLFQQDAADMLRLIDYIAGKIGLPDDQELSRDNFNAWLATPPVRGDRDEIARIVFANFPDDIEWEDHNASHLAAFNIADAILSLPVQPATRPDREAFYAILKNYVPQESIDQAWQELKEAGVQSGAGERE